MRSVTNVDSIMSYLVLQMLNVSLRSRLSKRLYITFRCVLIDTPLLDGKGENAIWYAPGQTVWVCFDIFHNEKQDCFGIHKIHVLEIALKR